MVARSPHYNRVMIYSLDRILDLEVSEKTFYYPEEFNPQSYFDACFGIVADDDIGIETVQLKVYAPQDKYFDALPLHHSQRTEKLRKDIPFTNTEYGQRMILCRSCFRTGQMWRFCSLHCCVAGWVI